MAAKKSGQPLDEWLADPQNRRAYEEWDAKGYPERDLLREVVDQTTSKSKTRR